MVGSQKSQSGMPPEIVNLITGAWEEMGGLREMLIGQMMGIMSGGGPFERGTGEGTPGRYEKQFFEPEYDPISGDPLGPSGYQDVWIPGTPGADEWQQTGGPGVQIPIISQAQEAQRRATSSALGQTQESLALKGLAGTPFGEQTMASQRQQGAQAVAGIPADVTQWFMQMIPGFTQGQASSVMGALPGTRESDAKGLNLQSPIGLTIGA
jgi:hypothetical protein